MRQVLADEPAPPQRLQPKVPADVETACLKCLEKRPARRYATALELAEELRLGQGRRRLAPGGGAGHGGRRPGGGGGRGGAFLIYARLLGRLAWKIGRLPTGKRKAAKTVRPPAGRVEANDPWAAPVEEKKPDREPEEETTAYGRKKRRTKGYGLAPEEPSQRPEITPLDGYPSVGEEPQPSDLDRRIHQRAKRPDVPKRPLLGGVFTFPGYCQSRKA